MAQWSSQGLTIFLLVSTPAGTSRWMLAFGVCHGNGSGDSGDATFIQPFPGEARGRELGMVKDWKGHQEKALVWWKSRILVYFCAFKKICEGRSHKKNPHPTSPQNAKVKKKTHQSFPIELKWRGLGEKKEGRCDGAMVQLPRVSWMSPMSHRGRESFMKNL